MYPSNVTTPAVRHQPTNPQSVVLPNQGAPHNVYGHPLQDRVTVLPPSVGGFTDLFQQRDQIGSRVALDRAFTASPSTMTLAERQLQQFRPLVVQQPLTIQADLQQQLNLQRLQQQQEAQRQLEAMQRRGYPMTNPNVPLSQQGSLPGTVTNMSDFPRR